MGVVVVVVNVFPLPLVKSRTHCSFARSQYVCTDTRSEPSKWYRPQPAIKKTCGIEKVINTSAIKGTSLSNHTASYTQMQQPLQ